MITISPWKVYKRTGVTICLHIKSRQGSIKFSESRTLALDWLDLSKQSDEHSLTCTTPPITARSHPEEKWRKPDWKILKLRKWVQGAGKMARRLGKGTSGHDQVRENEKLNKVRVERIRHYLCIWIRKWKLYFTQFYPSSVLLLWAFIEFRGYE